MLWLLPHSLTHSCIHSFPLSSLSLSLSLRLSDLFPTGDFNGHHPISSIASLFPIQTFPSISSAFALIDANLDFEKVRASKKSLSSKPNAAFVPDDFDPQLDFDRSVGGRPGDLLCGGSLGSLGSTRPCLPAKVTWVKGQQATVETFFFTVTFLWRENFLRSIWFVAVVSLFELH